MFDHPHGALQAHLVVAQAGKTEEQLALKGSVPRRPISAQLNVHCCTPPQCQQKCPSSNSPSSLLRPALQTCQLHAAAAHLAGGGGKRYVWEVHRRKDNMTNRHPAKQRGSFQSGGGGEAKMQPTLQLSTPFLPACHPCCQPPCAPRLSM